MALHVLLARQRSGTGALGSLLDQHPQISYYGEVFHPDEIDREHNYFNFLLKKAKGDPNNALPSANEQNYRDYIAQLESSGQKGSVLIDVKYSSTHHFNGYWHSPLDPPGFLQICQRERRKIIHLKRHNLLKTRISGLLAEHNKIWHATPEDTITVKTLTLDTEEVLGFLASMSQQVTYFDNYLGNYPQILTLSYENLFQASGTLASDTSKSLAAFLEVDEEPFNTLTPFFVKQASDDLSAVIENYDEISSCLNNTRFAWMLTP